MPAEIQWDDSAQTHLLIIITAPIAWSEFGDAIRIAHETAASVDHTIDLFIWSRTALPQGFALPNLRSAFLTQPPNVGRVVIIPEDKPTMLMFVKRLANVIQQVFPKKGSIIFVDSLEAARQLDIENRAKPVL